MKQSTKTIILWVVLIVMFVAIYQVFSVPPDPNNPRPTTEVSPGMSRFFQLLPLLIIGLFVFFWFRLTRGPWVKRANEAHAAFSSGRLSEALQKWTESAALAKKQPMPRFNMGIARLCLWQLDAARAEIEAALKLSNAFSTAANPPLALIAALQDRRGDSQQFMLSASQAGEKNVGNLSLAEAVLLCRDRRWVDALPVLRRSEVLNLGGTVGALARTLEAWCAWEVHGEKRHIDRVALFGEAHPDGLKAAWPELVAFIDPRAP